jgi:hypothetical protein
MITSTVFVERNYRHTRALKNNYSNRLFVSLDLRVYLSSME